CTYRFSLSKTHKITRFVHIENDDRELIFLAKRKRRHIHNIQTLIINLLECDLVITHSVRIFLRIRSINTVYTGSFQHYIRLNLDCTKRSTSISSKIWVTSTGSKDHNTSFFKMPHRAAANK